MKEIPFNNFNSFYLNNKDKIMSIVDETLSSGKFIRDKNIEELESKLADICNKKYAITTSSCTDALFFALKSAGITKGDEVILPTFSYIASLSPILMCNAIPVFADIDPDNLMLDCNNLESLITKRTKAIVFVQLFGSCINFEKLKTLASKYDLALIEDAAQALGSKYGNMPGASFGDISCISFDPTKIVSAFGTGGAVLTDNFDYYSKILKLIHHGRNENDEFEMLGYNSKIPALNAALINLQLEDLPLTINLMIEKATYYYKCLNNIEQIKCFFPSNKITSTFHKFLILANDRDLLKKHLASCGIETRVHYNPLLHEQILLKNYSFIKHDLSIAISMKNKVLSLPIYPDLSFEEIDYICNCISTFYSI